MVSRRRTSRFSATGLIRVRRTIRGLHAALLALAPLTIVAAGADEPPAAPPPSAAPEPAPSTDQAALFARVGRLLQSRCAMPGCHLGPDSMKGMRMEAAQIYRSTVNVPSRTDPGLLRLAPGAPDRSLLYLKLLPQEQGHYRGPRMPLSMNPLTPEEIVLVRQWIESFPADLWGVPPPPEKATMAPRTVPGATLRRESVTHARADLRLAHEFSQPGRPARDDRGRRRRRAAPELQDGSHRRVDRADLRHRRRRPVRVDRIQHRHRPPRLPHLCDQHRRGPHRSVRAGRRPRLGLFPPRLQHHPDLHAALDRAPLRATGRHM